MSEPVPQKMSQFEIATSLPSGSYFIAVVPTGSSFENKRVTRWCSVPVNGISPGNDGDEAHDSSGGYYIRVGTYPDGMWYRFQGTPLPF